MKKSEKPVSVDICPKCGSYNITVIDTRNIGYRKRLKKCLDCNNSYSTIEMLITEYNSLKDMKALMANVYKLFKMMDGDVEC